MRALEAPALPVFVGAQAMSNIDVASQCLPSIAAIHAYDEVMLHRYSRSQGLFWLDMLAQLADRPMNCIDEIRKLIRCYLMVGDVFADDLGGQMRVVSVRVHINIPTR
jgi:hypothetical protein